MRATLLLTVVLSLRSPALWKSSEDPSKQPRPGPKPTSQGLDCAGEEPPNPSQEAATELEGIAASKDEDGEFASEALETLSSVAALTAALAALLACVCIALGCLGTSWCSATVSSRQRLRSSVNGACVLLLWFAWHGVRPIESVVSVCMIGAALQLHSPSHLLAPARRHVHKVLSESMFASESMQLVAAAVGQHSCPEPAVASAAGEEGNVAAPDTVAERLVTTPLPSTSIVPTLTPGVSTVRRRLSLEAMRLQRTCGSPEPQGEKLQWAKGKATELYNLSQAVAALHGQLDAPERDSTEGNVQHQSASRRPAANTPASKVKSATRRPSAGRTGEVPARAPVEKDVKRGGGLQLKENMCPNRQPSHLATNPRGEPLLAEVAAGAASLHCGSQWPRTSSIGRPWEEAASPAGTGQQSRAGEPACWGKRALQVNPCRSAPLKSQSQIYIDAEFDDVQFNCPHVGAGGTAGISAFAKLCELVEREHAFALATLRGRLRR